MQVPLWRALAGEPPPLPALSGDVSCEVAVVGLGSSGLAALSELGRRGVDALGLDGGGVADGAAGRNGGFLLAGLPWFHHDAVRALGRERAVACYEMTRQELEAMYDEMPVAVRRTGSLRIAADERELADCHQQLDAMRSDGLPVERWNGEQGAGLLFPADASFQPEAACRLMAERLTRMGLPLYGRSPVSAIAPGRVVTGGGTVSCRAVLVCIDGRLEQLLAELVGTVRSARLQMLATAPLLREVAKRPVYRRYGFDYWQQLDTGELVLGGCRDIGGEEEWTTEALPSERVQIELERLLVETVGLPAGDALVTHRWAGIVGYTSSGLPVIGEVRRCVFAAGGYCGTGNLIGRLAGRALVELALDGASRTARLFGA